MEIDQLTNDQIANLTPEQIEMLEHDPSRLGEVLGKQSASDGPEQPEAVAPGETGDSTGEEEPVVLNKSARGIIPYKKHKELRVENSALREQLKAAQLENSKAAGQLEALLKKKDSATGADVAVAEDAIEKHLELIRENMPELHQVISAVLEGSRKQSEKLEKTLEELKREKEESERANRMSIQEQVADAKENNPDLVHWESNDPQAWDEAMKQDEILRTSTRWAGKPYSERFEEVVRRVRAIMPEVSLPKKYADPEQTKVDAKAKLSSASVRKPITLSDIQGGANPASEREQIDNLSPHELARKLMQMPSHKAAALRAELE
jgi:hypothetical protein